MFIRAYEKGECPEHGTRCSTAALFECDNCHHEFVVHGTYKRAQIGNCSQKCAIQSGYRTIAAAKEAKRKFQVLKYGRSYTKVTTTK